MPSGSPDNIWCSYHQAEVNARRLLFPGKPFGSWKRPQFLKEAQRRIPQLTKADKDAVDENLQIAKRGRVRMLKEFPYSTEEATARHQLAVEFLEELLFHLRQVRVTSEERRAENAQSSSNQEQTDTDSDGQLDEHAPGTSTPHSGEDYVRKDMDAQETLDQDMEQTFIESIAASVDIICDSWIRVATKNMEISCATAGEQESYPQAEISLKYERCNLAVPDTFLRNRQHILHQPTPFHRAAQQASPLSQRPISRRTCFSEERQRRCCSWQEYCAR